jgi:hypothetical protein
MISPLEVKEQRKLFKYKGKIDAKGGKELNIFASKHWYISA